MLEERQDASLRFNTILAELERIGDVQINWGMTTEGETSVVTERRAGLIVDADSSMEKLLAAYTAYGGNPFDISMFLVPESQFFSGDDLAPAMPASGVLYSHPTSYTYTAQMPQTASLIKYDLKAVGGTGDERQDSESGNVISHAHSWIKQEIRQKRGMVENRILKLCDLREQLYQELSNIVWGCGPTVSLPQNWDDDKFSTHLTAARIAYRFDSIFRVPDADNPQNVPIDNEINADALAENTNLLEDADGRQQKNTAF